MTSADKWVTAGGLLFFSLVAWLFSVADAFMATLGLGLFWLCTSRGWLTFSWQYSIVNDELVSWKPFGVRLAASLMALLFGGLLLFCLGGMWQQLPLPQSLPLGAIVLAFLGPITALMLWAAGRMWRTSTFRAGPIG